MQRWYWRRTSESGSAVAGHSSQCDFPIACAREMPVSRSCRALTRTTRYSESSSMNASPSSRISDLARLSAAARSSSFRSFTSRAVMSRPVPPSIATGSMLPSHQVSRSFTIWAWHGTCTRWPARALACIDNAMSRVPGKRSMMFAPRTSSGLNTVERSQTSFARSTVPSGATRQRAERSPWNSRSTSGLAERVS